MANSQKAWDLAAMAAGKSTAEITTWWYRFNCLVKLKLVPVETATDIRFEYDHMSMDVWLTDKDRKPLGVEFHAPSEEMLAIQVDGLIELAR
jgi:hypothetical protein